MKQGYTLLMDFEINYNDEDGNNFSKTFAVDEDVIDYIEYIEEMLAISEDEVMKYRLFFCQHFANMTNLN